MSVGASESFGFSRQKSSDDSRDLGSNVWGPQSPYLQDLYARSQDLSMKPTNGLYRLDQAGQLLKVGQGYLGAGADQIGQANAGLGQMAGFVPGQMNPQLAAYGRQVSDMYNQQIAPQLRGNAAVAGQLGSSRAGLAEATAAGQVQRNLQDFAGEQYQQDMNRQLQALQAQQAGGAALGQFGSAAGGLAGQFLPMAQMEAMAPWLGLQNYSALLGAPVMQDLGGFQQVRSSGWSHNRAMSGSFSMMGMGGGGG